MLIEVFHIVAGEYPVDADATGDIERGSFVELANTGLVRLSTNGTAPLGIAGDSRSTGTAYTAYSANLRIGANGAYTRSTQNRVADMFNETLASGKITVYSNGGLFRISSNLLVAGANTAPNTPLYPHVPGLWDSTANGCPVVAATVVADVAAYPSGVPGGYPTGGVNGGTNAYGPTYAAPTDNTVQGSLSLGDFLLIRLLV
jgi:hypothetical protein